MAKKYLNEYRDSSYLDYIGTPRAESKILMKETFPEYFETVRDFETEVTDWLSYYKEEES